MKKNTIKYMSYYEIETGKLQHTIVYGKHQIDWSVETEYNDDVFDEDIIKVKPNFTKIDDDVMESLGQFLNMKTKPNTLIFVIDKIITDYEVQALNEIVGDSPGRKRLKKS